MKWIFGKKYEVHIISTMDPKISLVNPYVIMSIPKKNIPSSFWHMHGKLGKSSGKDLDQFQLEEFPNALSQSQ